MHTFTRTHVHEQFADPHLVCGRCGHPVTGWHDQEFCGCYQKSWNDPCGHENAGVVGTCPSWGPVDGCTCTPACVVGERRKTAL